MGTAIGMAIPNTHGDTFFDVWEWGGRPGDQTTGSVDKALEAIRNYIINVRDVNATVGNSPAVIYFRESTQTWWLQRPFFVERNRWEIRGAGRLQTLVNAVAGSRQPCFIFGLSRRPANATFVGYDGINPIVLDPGHWVDSFGVLDTSAVTATGQKWGLRFKNDSYVSCPLTPFSHGISDGWLSTRQMTVDFCIDVGSGFSASTVPLFGMSRQEGTGSGPLPWYFFGFGTNFIRFVFATTGLNQPTQQTVQFSIGAARGVVKVSFQIDLATAKTQAYVNGTQVAVQINFPLVFLASNNMSFAQNQYAPFNLGMQGISVIGVNTSLSPPVDHTYYGLRIANALMYTDAGAGNPQINAVGSHSGVAPTDYERYFDLTRNCVASFPMTDPPTGNINCFNDGRCVTITGGSDGSTHGSPFKAVGYFLTICTSSTPVLTSNNRIKDISVSNGAPLTSGTNGTPPGGWRVAFGQAIAIGAVWEMFIENVTASSCGHGVGSLSAGATFTVHINDLISSGGDAAYYGYDQGIWLKDFRVVNMGRTGMRLVSCFTNMENLTFGDSFNCDVVVYIHGSEYGGTHNITNLMSDNEAGDGPYLAGIICESVRFSPVFLKLNVCGFGKVADSAVLIWLKDNNGGKGDFTNPGIANTLKIVEIDLLSAFGTNHTANIRTDGTLWGGEIRNYQAANGGYSYSETVPMFDHTGANGRGRITHRSSDYMLPPRGGKWDANCHKLEMQFPAPGCYSVLRCFRSGTYGTNTPPLWNGSDIIDTGDNNIGGYIVDNVYFNPVNFS